MLAADLLHLNLAAIIIVSRSFFAQSGLIAEEEMETAVVVVSARMIGTHPFIFRNPAEVQTLLPYWRSSSHHAMLLRDR